MFKAVPELIQRDQAYIVEVVNVWIKGKEARVRVVMKSRRSRKYRAEEDFLLYKKRRLENIRRRTTATFPRLRNAGKLPAELKASPYKVSIKMICKPEFLCSFHRQLF